MDRERNQEDHQGGSFHPFLLGVIVGVALTLLFTTKKGRKILKTLTDQGMDKIEKWEEVLYKKMPATEEVEEVDEMMQAQDYEAAEELKEELSPQHVSEHAVKQALKADPANGKAAHGVRRFFKGAKKA